MQASYVGLMMLLYLQMQSIPNTVLKYQVNVQIGDTLKHLHDLAKANAKINGLTNRLTNGNFLTRILTLMLVVGGELRC